MRKLEALLITKNRIRHSVLNWQISIVENTEKAIEKLFIKPYKIIAVGEDIPMEDFAKAKKIISVTHRNTLVVKVSNHQNIGDQIKKAYFANKFKSSAYKVLDNSFEMELTCALNQNNN